MSNKIMSLGSAGSAAACITITGSTNATPIVVTFGAGHGLKNGDRVAVAGITGNTGANGIWTLQFTGANTARLLGSVGNGTHGGTPRVGVVFDATPHMRNHSAVVDFAGVAPVATLVMEAFANYADFAAGRNDAGAIAPVNDPAITNTNGGGATPASSTITNPVNSYEIQLPLILRASLSAWTSGTVAPRILA